jgi:hypothetical protein
VARVEGSIRPDHGKRHETARRLLIVVRVRLYALTCYGQSHHYGHPLEKPRKSLCCPWKEQ